MIYLIYVALAVLAFLVCLNEFLKGAKKGQIVVVLTLLQIALVIAAFIVEGLWSGMMAIAIPFLSAVVFRPVGAHAASRLLGLSNRERTGYVGLPPRFLERISQQLGRHIEPTQFVNEILGGRDPRGKAEAALLDYCASRPAIRAIMDEHGMSRENLKDLYHLLLRAGTGQWACGHWVAASALAYPASLRYVLARGEKDPEETAFRLIMYFEQGAALEF